MENVRAGVIEGGATNAEVQELALYPRAASDQIALSDDCADVDQRLDVLVDCDKSVIRSARITIKVVLDQYDPAGLITASREGGEGSPRENDAPGSAGFDRTIGSWHGIEPRVRERTGSRGITARPGRPIRGADRPAGLVGGRVTPSEAGLHPRFDWRQETDNWLQPRRGTKCARGHQILAGFSPARLGRRFDHFAVRQVRVVIARGARGRRLDCCDRDC